MSTRGIFNIDGNISHEKHNTFYVTIDDSEGVCLINCSNAQNLFLIIKHQIIGDKNGNNKPLVSYVV